MRDDSQLTATRLIDYFESKIAQEDRSRYEAKPGNEPCFPMLLFFLGADAISGYSVIKTNLLKIWPQYHSVLRFYGVELVDGNPEFTKLGDSGSTRLSEDEMRDDFDELLEFGDDFAEYEYQALYYFIDTSSLRTGSELQDLLEIIPKIIETLDVEPEDVLEMLFVLLDERRRKKRVATGLRNVLAPMCDGDGLQRYRVVLLSNKLENGSMNRDNAARLRIASSVIALSNNHNKEIADRLFDRGVLTASHVLEEKPVRSIGQVFVSYIIDNAVIHEEKKGSIGNLRGLQLKKRLGITSDGTIGAFDGYVEEQLVSRLPNSDTINLFPRKSDSDTGNLSSLRAGPLDDLTMGTFSACLTEIVEDAQLAVHNDYHLRESLSELYRQHLNGEFSSAELVYLAGHKKDVCDCFSQAGEPSSEGMALEYGRQKLRMLFSSNDDVVDICLGVLDEQGSNLFDFYALWNQLRSSRLQIHEVDDENLVSFYEQKASHFLDTQRGREACAKFVKASSQEELEAYLHEAIDSFIDDNRQLLINSFEVELGSRLASDGRSQSPEVRDYLRGRLINNSRTYFNVTSSSLGECVLSAVMRKEDTGLARLLGEVLDQTSYYYDTGYGNAVEVLELKRVSSINLRTGEGE